jgi:hypothetical protein
MGCRVNGRAILYTKSRACLVSPSPGIARTAIPSGYYSPLDPPSVSRHKYFESTGRMTRRKSDEHATLESERWVKLRRYGFIAFKANRRLGEFSQFAHVIISFLQVAVGAS